MSLQLPTRKQLANQRGFTLIELLVVIGILAILLAITLVALNPTKHFQGARNAQRSSDVTAILDGIYEYEAANKGTLPPSLSTATSTATPLATTSGDIEVCSDLVPTYIADLPLDPTTGTKTPAGGSTCSATSYDSGYTIALGASNRITIAAPSAEDGAVISVTR
jgi:prepilin-type N-terminal cleavage/methylation domain-containing protein